MSLIVVDAEKCKRDGICVNECPFGIIQLKDKEATPTPDPEAESLCINCGHCVAVCPHGALSLETMPTGECRPIQNALLPNRDQLSELMMSRRSVRIFKDEPVDRQTITDLIDVARYAPSGHNTQPVSWLVIHDAKKVNTLAGHVIEWMKVVLKENPDFGKAMHMDRSVEKWNQGIDGVCRNAPHLIVAHAPAAQVTAPAACTIAMTWLELAAPTFGLGACWAGYFNAAAMMFPPLQQALALPEGHTANGSMMIGYPKVKYHRIPFRDSARIDWL